MMDGGANPVPARAPILKRAPHAPAHSDFFLERLEKQAAQLAAKMASPLN